MIIKSLSRKIPSFKSLIQYINKTSTDTTITNNFTALTTHSNDNQSIINEFMQNSQLLSTRKNGNYLYHEIISIKTTSDIPTKRIESVLSDIAYKYIHLRAKNHLCYAKIHLNTSNPHIHFCISANELNSNKRVRLSKNRFKTIQQELESYFISKYKEFDNKPVYNKDTKAITSSKLKLTNKQQELKQRTNKPTQTEQIKELLETIFNQAKTQEELLKLLDSNNLEIYQRGKTISVKNLSTSKKYRLKTLKLEELFLSTKEKLKQTKQRVLQLKDTQLKNKDYKTISMNVKQAKSIKLIELLPYLNHKIISKRNNDYWFNSPFRDEKTPSFKVDNLKNIWYDHGIGKGGNILDFALQYFNINSISQALKELTNIKANHLINDSSISNLILPFDKTITTNKEIIKSTIDISTNNKLELNSIKELNNIALLEYLESRAINPDVAKRFLKEAYYKANDKQYFSLAFENQSQGYELRNKYFKSCIGTKDISFIDNNNRKNISLFEGFFDYLTALQFFNGNSSDVIILNSTALITKATQFRSYVV